MIRPNARITTCSAPEEVFPNYDHYILRGGVEAREPLNHTALRKAERLFKSHTATTKVDYDLAFDKDVGKLDLVLDDTFINICGIETAVRIYRLKEEPSFYVIPNAIPSSIQKSLVDLTFKEIFPFFPINLDGVYDYEKKTLFETFANNPNEILQITKIDESKQIPLRPIELIKKIRWATLGYNYDWSTKEYKFKPGEFNPIPSAISQICKEIIAKISAIDPLFNPEFYSPEAGIVNYYQPNSTLTSHIDRSELNDVAPLVSMSIGNDAVFLLGGETREYEPVKSFKLHSGDIVIMSGKSRRYFHGIPKIFPNTSPFNTDPLMINSRVNINIRQVF